MKHIGIRDGDRDYSGLIATEALALRLRHHLFGETLRFRGSGSWLRHQNGEWELRSFRITDFENLSDESLGTVVGKLRRIGGLTGSKGLAQSLLQERADEQN